MRNRPIPLRLKFASETQLGSHNSVIFLLRWVSAHLQNVKRSCRRAFELFPRAYTPGRLPRDSFLRNVDDIILVAKMNLCLGRMDFFN